jgi:L-fucose isomerase-like protein
VPEASLKKIARLGAAIDTWMQENDLQASAIQCWNALEGLFGVVPCTAMSMMSNNLLPSACEVDVTGALAMVILQLASGQPSALVDWNNNYQSEPDKCVIFHCSNLPREMLQAPKMEYAPILASTLGQQNTYGTISGRIRPGRFTFARVSTDDLNGVIRAYTGEGEISDAPLATFGGYGVVHVPDLQRLLQYICRQGFEHHVAINLSESARAVAEALELYLGWEVYHHGECAV